MSKLSGECHICSGSQELSRCGVCRKLTCWVHLSSYYDREDKYSKEVCSECIERDPSRFGDCSEESDRENYDELINKIEQGQKTFNEEELSVILKALKKLGMDY